MVGVGAMTGLISGPRPSRLPALRARDHQPLADGGPAKVSEMFCIAESTPVKITNTVVETN